MNISEVYERIEEIKRAKGDAETAHDMEDALYQDFVAEIAGGDLYGDKAELLAQLILKTRAIEFPRWTA